MSDLFDFFQVDTHIHASSAMNQKHLLRFIKKTMKTCADEKVCKDRDGRVMTLKEVWISIDLFYDDAFQNQNEFLLIIILL